MNSPEGSPWSISNWKLSLVKYCVPDPPWDRRVAGAQIVIIEHSEREYRFFASDSLKSRNRLFIAASDDGAMNELVKWKFTIWKSNLNRFPFANVCFNKGRPTTTVDILLKPRRINRYVMRLWTAHLVDFLKKVIYFMYKFTIHIEIICRRCSQRSAVSEGIKHKIINSIERWINHMAEMISTRLRRFSRSSYRNLLQSILTHEIGCLNMINFLLYSEYWIIYRI